MSMLDLEKLKTILNEFSTEREWDRFHSVKNLSMALSVECSELLEISQWISEEESNQIKFDPQKKQMLQDEVADIFIYLLRIVNKTDINLEEAVLEKMEKNKLKYPVDKSKGTSKKYNEF